MNISDLMQKLRAIESQPINEGLTLATVAQAEKAAADDAAAKKAKGGWGGFTSFDPKTAGNVALAQLAQQNGLPGLFNSSGEFVVALGDAEWSSKPNAPRTAPPNKDDQMALQKAGLIPSNAEGPAGLTDFLSGGAASKEFAATKAAAQQVNATNTSNEFIKTKLGELQKLVAQLKGEKVAEGVKLSALSLLESFQAELEEGGITLPNPDGSLPAGAFTADDQVKLNQQAGKQALIAKIKEVMAQLADIEDPAVHAALADAQAAIDAAGAAPVDKKKDRERLQQLIDITKKPPVADDTGMEETYQPLSEGEKMASLRNKLLLLERSLGEAPRLPRLPNLGSTEKAAETLPKVIGTDVAKVEPVWKIDQTGPKTIDMGKAVEVPKPGIKGPEVQMDPSKPGFDFKKASQAAAGSAAVAGATYLATQGGDKKDAPAQSGQQAAPADTPAATTKSAPSATKAAPSGSQDGATGQALAKLGVTKQNRLDQAFVDNALGAGKYKAGTAESNLALLAHFKAKGGNTPATSGAPAAAGAKTASKTNLTKYYADEMKEMDELIKRNQNDPEMADIVKAAQTQLDALKATGQ